MYSNDVASDVDHLSVKRILLVGFSYIVIEDNKSCVWWDRSNEFIQFFTTSDITSSSNLEKELY
jgi:hypothetical protein